MAFRREAALCYGRTGKYVILGGENANFQLFGRTVSDSYSQFSVVAGFRTHVLQATEADRSAERLKLATIVSEGLNQFSGDLTLAVRTKASGSGSLSSNPSITNTNSVEGGPRVVGQVSFDIDTDIDSGDVDFVGDVGSLLSIEGVGTFRINSLEVAVGGVNFTVSGADLGPVLALSSGAGPYNVRLLQSVYNFDEGDWYGAYHARPTVNEAPDGNDNPNRTTYTFSASFIKPALDSRDLGRLEAGVSGVLDASSRQTVVFNGRYTGYNANSAKGQYEAAAKSWASGVLSADYTGDFDLIGESFDYDDEESVLNFELLYEEVLFPENAAGGLVAAIKDATIIMSRRLKTANRGIQSDAPVFADINYSCSVDNTVTGHAGLVSLYEDTIRPLIIAQTKAKFGATNVYIDVEQPSIDPTGNKISVYISAYLAGVGSPTIEFARTISYQITMDRSLRKRLRGGQQDYRSSSAFPDIAATVTTIETREGTPTLLPGVAIQNGGYQPINPSTYQVIAEPGGLLFDPPGGPPFGSAVLSEGQWNFMGGGVNTGLSYIGQYGTGATRLLVSTTAVTTEWLWGVVENQPANGGGSSGSSELEPQLERQEGFVGFSDGISPFAPPAELSETAIQREVDFQSLPGQLTSPIG